MSLGSPYSVDPRRKSGSECPEPRRSGIQASFLNFAASSDPPVALPGAVGMRAGAGELAAVDDQILVADRPALEIAFEDFARAGRIARLRGERCARRYAASCRDAAWCATGDPSAPAAGTRRRRHSPRAGRSPAPGRWRRGRRSCRARCSRDRRRASSSKASSSLNRCSVSGWSGQLMRDDVADLDHVLDVSDAR